MSNNKKNFSINEIETILELFYKKKLSITRISKDYKFSATKVKSIINKYSSVYIEKYPEYKLSENITIDEFKHYLENKTKIEIENENESPFL